MFNLVQHLILYIIIVLDNNKRVKQFENFQAGSLDKRVD